MIQIWNDKTIIAIRENKKTAEEFCKEKKLENVRLIEVKE